MKRNLTFLGAKQLLLALVALFGFTAPAQAGDTWYAYYAQLQAYPSGAGQVYATPDFIEESAVPQWTGETELEMVSTAGGYNAYAKPAEGWLFAGFSSAYFDETGQPVFDDYVIEKANPGYLSLLSEITDNPSGDESIQSDSTVVAAMMPLEYNNVHYALFTRVLAQYAPGQDVLGQISVSPVCNNIGDEVTLSAEAVDDEMFPNTKFEKWTLNGQTVSTEPTFTITVTDTARYVAHFTSDAAETIDFGTGKFLHIYPGDNTDISIPENVKVWQFFADSLNTSGGAAASYMPQMEAGYNIMAGQASILYGKGQATLVKITNEYAYPDERLLNRWSGEGVEVATLATTHTYYTLDESLPVLRKAEGRIPANVVYVALPDSAWNGQMEANPGQALTAAPQVIFLSKQAAENGETAIRSLEAQGVATRQGIYTLDGRKAQAMDRKAIYILDGRKVIKK